MNKLKFIGIGLIFVAVVIGIFFVKERIERSSNTPAVSQKLTDFDPRNATFEIEGKEVTLIKGIFEEEIPSSVSKITTRYFGNDAKGDLNSDGKEDIAFLITQDGGGSGTFYYVVVALETENGYKTTNAYLVGDRIAPQSTNIISEELHVNYAERKLGESMTTEPSQGMTLFLKVTKEGGLQSFKR